jgi:hypothetical protein
VFLVILLLLVIVSVSKSNLLLFCNNEEFTADHVADNDDELNNLCLSCLLS